MSIFNWFKKNSDKSTEANNKSTQNNTPKSLMFEGMNGGEMPTAISGIEVGKTSWDKAKIILQKFDLCTNSLPGMQYLFEGPINFCNHEWSRMTVCVYNNIVFSIMFTDNRPNFDDFERLDRIFEQSYPNFYSSSNKFSKDYKSVSDKKNQIDLHFNNIDPSDPLLTLEINNLSLRNLYLSPYLQKMQDLECFGVRNQEESECFSYIKEDGETGAVLEFYTKDGILDIDGDYINVKDIKLCELTDNPQIFGGNYTATSVANSSVSTGNILKRVVIGGAIGGIPGAIIGGMTSNQKSHIQTSYKKEDERIYHRVTMTIVTSKLKIYKLYFGGSIEKAEKLELLLQAAIK